MSRLGSFIGEKVHVIEARRATLEHLSDGDACSVTDKLGAHECPLGWPDVLLQPGHELQVIGQPAQQRHRTMRVGIYHARQQDAARP